MIRLICSGISGILFGVGLVISGMTNTTKVQGWLDIFGTWDPTLTFVMGGAILPMSIAWIFTKKRKPLTGGEFPEPNIKGIDKKLIYGSIFFGAGWGISGLCPGPAITSLSSGVTGIYVFFCAMAIGMYLASRLNYVDS